VEDIMTRGAKRIPLVIAAFATLGCAAAPATPASETPPPIAGIARDTGSQGLVPAGFGSLKQDDISIRFQLRGLLVRATPLDESIIRVLAPDSYRSLRDRRESERDRIAALAARYGVRGFSIWSISFYGLEPDVRFAPQDVVVSSVGRDFRPIELIPLTTGFGENRLDQRDTQTALYLFDEAVDVNQPLTVMVETVRSSGWDETLRNVERERALIRSRAGRSGSVPPG
jgi:hypothetical protein